MEITKPKQFQFLATLLILCATVITVPVVCDANYSSMVDMIKGKLDGYNPDVRPLLDQSKRITVRVGFHLLSLIELDDVQQKFSINGMLIVDWQDELISWNPSDYGNVTYINPPVRSVWRPRVVQKVTLAADRDPFQDKHCPLRLFYTGETLWLPGGVLSTMCPLDMEKYPYDVQDCAIELCPMQYGEDQIRLTVDVGVVRAGYIKNEGWELLNITLNRTEYKSGDIVQQRCAAIKVKLKRRPLFYVVSIILPAVVLSLLNNFVFVIPDYGGEKISYGMTVLLALAVFMSIISSQMPRATSSISYLTKYLFFQLLVSTLSVITSIIIVSVKAKGLGIQNMDSESEESTKNWTVSKESATWTREMNRPADVDYCPAPIRDHDATIQIVNSKDRTFRRRLGSHVNKICFVVVMMLWAFSTAAYFIAAAS